MAATSFVLASWWPRAVVVPILAVAWFVADRLTIMALGREASIGLGIDYARMMQIGLVILAEHFNEEGWFWGGGYNREDGMHFEVGEETLQKWVDEGLIPSQ